MNRSEFHHLALQGLLLDGAMGTELMKAGMPAGSCPELWCLEHPKAFQKIQKAYLTAGSRILYAPTFGCNRIKLAEYHLEKRTEELAEALVRLTKEAAGDNAMVLGDLAPTGQFVAPYGPLSFSQAEEIYAETARAMLRGGADGFIIETMMDLQEARAAYLGVRRVAPDLPILVTMTFEPGGKSMTGTDPVCALTVFQALGADAFGCNCSAGPAEMLHLIASLQPYARIPLIAKPNAGLPRCIDGQTIFPMGPDEFGTAAASLRQAGALLLGGCCGTTPDHIAALQLALASVPLPSPWTSARKSIVCSSGEWTEFSQTQPLRIIGERINPTGKKALQAELRAGETGLIHEFALQQKEAGADLLDVNVGLSGISETEMMAKAVSRLVPAISTPLCIDTTDPAAAEAALQLYPGRALFNSISAENNRLEHLLPIAARYGAMLILLPVTDQGVPATAEERITVIQTLLTKVKALGYRNEDLCIDPLILTASADATAPNTALAVIRWCAEQGLHTVCGLSNVSFGLPARRVMNGTFLAMAVAHGLTAAIANPLFPEIQDQAAAASALAGRDAHQAAYLRHFTETKTDNPPVAGPEAPLSTEEKITRAILQGDSNGILPLLTRALESGAQPISLLKEIMIPAISEVGRRYEAKTYFLPQLIMSAEAMQKGTSFLEPMFAGDSQKHENPARMLFATVKGDIHDIGKNIVIAILRSHGIDVVDLGKDVAPETIIEAARSRNISIIALSALMTTTMPAMRKTVELARSQGLQATFLVGGAVVDAEFAKEIGAVHTPDPMATVRAVLDIAKTFQSQKRGEI